MIHWQRVKYFKSYEFDDPNYPGSGELIDGVLLLQLHKLREHTGWPIITHWQVGGCIDVDGVHGHSKNSMHLKKNGCRAVDFHFDTNESIRLQAYEVLKAGFSGIGFYFDWKWDGSLLPIGFHVDVRDKKRTQIWTRKEGKYIYLLK